MRGPTRPRIGRYLVESKLVQLRFRRTIRPVILALVAASLSACAAGRAAVVRPLERPNDTVRETTSATRLTEPVRIDFTWELNEAGARVSGQGVARIEPPYHARLDLFMDLETVVAAALVDDELRLPPGAPDDILPPVDLMWGTLGVFRPLAVTRLVGGDVLDNQANRLRYTYDDGRELHFEVADGSVRTVELLEGDAVVEWVRTTGNAGERYPEAATYRNLVDFRELTITRTQIRPMASFDPAIWDPRQ